MGVTDSVAGARKGVGLGAGMGREVSLGVKSNLNFKKENNVLSA